eukprot:1152335-Pelagomonas_calceolata.AAC.2
MVRITITVVRTKLYVPFFPFVKKDRKIVYAEHAKLALMNCCLGIVSGFAKATCAKCEQSPASCSHFKGDLAIKLEMSRMYFLTALMDKKEKKSLRKPGPAAYIKERSPN